VQQTDSSIIASNEIKIPYISALGTLILVILFFVLWRPLNPERTLYVPLTEQVQMTVLENERLPTVVGKASIEIIEDRPSIQSQVTESLDQPKPEDDVVKDEIDNAIAQDDNLVQYTVGRGDSLYGIMNQYGVNRSDIYLLTKEYKQLANLRIGQQISWTTDSEHNLKTFNLIKSDGFNE